ncbi:hypothetical protein ACFFU8_09370 [Chromobacterium piscinae]|uniref:hypothetical protein n=1 Tax=Chromobacterium piscinae TaxID=686831 RepID=UPI001E2D26BC|nr:hypothetical protein [Chromobacterium piscinae]MCD5327886.1 hypothetical protein [Chromobacterium piscinae]
MRTTITAVLLLVVGAAAVAGSQADADFLQEKVNGWFAEAKPAAKGVWLTDAKGCLVSAFDDGTGIKLVKMLDARSKQPICRK